jgi:uncharacterized membrane protein
MASNVTSVNELPRNVEESVRSVAELHIEHHATATALDRVLDGVTQLVGHPVTLSMAVGATLIWLAAKTIEPKLGLSLIDPPAWLDRSVGLVSIYLALLILATQRRADRLAQRRDQLTLRSLHWSMNKRRQRLWLYWRNSGGTIRKLPIGSTV